MHIPDGYLGPQTYGTMYAVMMPLWWQAAAKLRAALPKKNLPLVALAAAFSFVIMMFNIPVPGGTTGHAIGGALIAIALGPWAAMIAVSTALVIQALVFADGGITAIAANCFTMAFVMPFSAFYIYRFIAGLSGPTEKEGPAPVKLNMRQKVAAFAAGYVSIVLAATATGVLFGLQPLISSQAGHPLYAPYPLAVAVPAMAIEHLLFFGPIEGIVTVLAVGYFARADGPIRSAFQRTALREEGGRI